MWSFGEARAEFLKLAPRSRSGSSGDSGIVLSDWIIFHAILNLMTNHPSMVFWFYLRFESYITSLKLFLNFKLGRSCYPQIRTLVTIVPL